MESPHEQRCGFVGLRTGRRELRRVHRVRRHDDGRRHSLGADLVRFDHREGPPQRCLADVAVLEQEAGAGLEATGTVERPRFEHAVWVIDVRTRRTFSETGHDEVRIHIEPVLVRHGAIADGLAGGSFQRRAVEGLVRTAAAIRLDVGRKAELLIRTRRQQGRLPPGGAHPSMEADRRRSQPSAA